MHCFNLEMTEEEFGKISSLYSKYKKNKENISEEDLHGRYKKAFLNLRNEISLALAEYTYANACMVYLPEGSPLFEDLAKLVKKNHPLIMKTLWESGLEEAVKKCDEVKDSFISEYYFPYIEKKGGFFDEEFN